MIAAGYRDSLRSLQPRFFINGTAIACAADEPLLAPSHAPHQRDLTGPAVRTGGGSPEAMKREIWRNYPVQEKAALVEDLLDRVVLADGGRTSKQPGLYRVTGCEVPAPSTAGH